MHHSQLTEFITDYNPESLGMYQEMAAHGLSTEQTSGFIAQQITSQGLIIAANEIFWLCVGLFIALIITVWFAKPPFGSNAK